MPYFYHPTKLETNIPPICMALSVIFAFTALFVSIFFSNHIPDGILPSMSWAGDVFPESIFFNLAMYLTAVQVLFVYLLYDREFRLPIRMILLFLVLICVVSLLILATVSVGNNNPVHSVAGGVAFFSLYIYVSLRMYFLWRQCKRTSQKGWMERFKGPLWILFGMFLFSVPVVICCFVFFAFYQAASPPKEYSLYYTFFVIFEWLSALTVDGMHIATWAAYNMGHTNVLL